MTPTASAFEDRLLDALLDRFDALTHQETAVLLPVPRRTRIRRYALPVACLAAAATAASVILELGGPAPAKHVESATPAYALAAWATQPTSADQAQISGAEALCSASFDPSGAAQPASAQKQPPLQAGGPWSAVLVDTRADLTLALYSDGTHWMACLAGPSFVSLQALDATGEPPVEDNSASLDKVSTRTASGDLYTVALGRTGSAVTGVGLQRVDGSVVTATVGNGRFIAWWPLGEGVKALSITSNTGTQNYPVGQRFSRSGPQPNNKTVDPLSRQPNNKSR
jgi:hypothetical protein